MHNFKRYIRSGSYLRQGRVLVLLKKTYLILIWTLDPNFFFFFFFLGGGGGGGTAHRRGGFVHSQALLVPHVECVTLMC